MGKGNRLCTGTDADKNAGPSCVQHGFSSPSMHLPAPAQSLGASAVPRSAPRVRAASRTSPVGTPRVLEARDRTKRAAGP